MASLGKPAPGQTTVARTLAATPGVALAVNLSTGFEREFRAKSDGLVHRRHCRNCDGAARARVQFLEDGVFAPSGDGGLRDFIHWAG